MKEEFQCKVYDDDNVRYHAESGYHDKHVVGCMTVVLQSTMYTHRIGVWCTTITIIPETDPNGTNINVDQNYSRPIFSLK